MYKWAELYWICWWWNRRTQNWNWRRHLKRQARLLPCRSEDPYVEESMWFCLHGGLLCHFLINDSKQQMRNYPLCQKRVCDFLIILVGLEPALNRAFILFLIFLFFERKFPEVCK